MGPPGGKSSVSILRRPCTSAALRVGGACRVWHNPSLFSNRALPPHMSAPGRGEASGPGTVPAAFERRKDVSMKAGIHPVYELRTFHCYGCGTEWETRTTLAPTTADGKVHLDICSNCHPFFTGKQRIVDKAGRVERFRRRYQKNEPAPAGS